MAASAAKIFLTFSNIQGKEPTEFSWDVLDSPLASRWLQEMHSALSAPDKIREQRFFGWDGSQNSQEKIIQRLNAAIDIINGHFKERYQISERASIEMGQDGLNALHHHFEILMGQSWKPSVYIKDLPLPVHIAILWLNDYVHDFEYSIGAKAKKLVTNGGFLCQILPNPQRELTLEDLQSLSYENEPGSLITNYCQLGKTWSDLYLDQDQHIEWENIAPLRYYHSGFIANFYSCSKKEADFFKMKVQQYMHKKASERGWQLEVNDPRQALGYATYARLTAGSPLLCWNKEELCDFFVQHPNISRIRLRAGSAEISRDFAEPESYVGLPRGSLSAEQLMQWSAQISP